VPPRPLSPRPSPWMRRRREPRHRRVWRWWHGPDEGTVARHGSTVHLNSRLVRLNTV
jgi:hypothetical protein